MNEAVGQGNSGSSLGSARAEGDSWDAASGVGATATVVAVGRALASRGPHPLLNDPFAEPLVRAVGHEFFTRLLDGEVTLNRANSTVTQQQRSEQMAVRTRFFDDFLLRATASGVRQAVILASGLDARAYRLAWPVGTVVFELDQPDVIDFKTRTLANLGATPAADLRAVGVDLRDDWVTALGDAGFDRSAPTAWIAEGLLMYLPPEAQDKLLDDVTAASAPGSCLATEQLVDIEMFADERTAAWRNNWRKAGLKLDVGELVWAGERHSPPDYLADTGWSVEVHGAGGLFASHGFELPAGEESAHFLGINYVSARRTGE